jgi:hypothetical protein
MADMFFNRFTAAVAAPAAGVVEETAIAPVAADGPIGVIAAATGDAQSTARPPSAPLPPEAPQFSIWDLIPKEPFGFPRVATVGTLLWLVVLFLVLKGYVGL